MTRAGQSPQQNPISVHKLPLSVLRKVDIFVFTWTTFTLILVSVLILAFFPRDMVKDETLGPLIPWIIIAMAVLADGGALLVYRFGLRQVFLREARCEIHADRMVWIAPPSTHRTIMRTDVQRVDELSPNGPLALSLSSGRTFKIPGDTERYDELKRSLLPWSAPGAR